jgi:DNA-binding transcriptional LysR family regulator
MSFFSYQIFDAVAKQQSFLRAAEVMNLTPSAVSHSISSLESSLGFPLFLRSRTGVKLTNEGELMLIHVRSILNCEEQLQQEAAQINGLEKGTVVIGAFSSVCTNWIPDIVKSFHNSYPNIDINIMQGDYEDVLLWAKTGVINIGFATLPTRTDLIETPLHMDRLLCIAPKDFKPVHSKYVTIDDIKDQPFILQREGYNADTLSFIKKYNLSIRPQFFIDDDQSIIAIVESGLGISIVPELILNKVRCNVNVYPIIPNEFRTIGLVTHKKQLLSPATLKMFDHIVSYIKNNNLMNL